jgi:hypothetical protein
VIRFISQVLYPEGKEPPVPIGQEAGWDSRVDLYALKTEKKTSSICRESNTKSLVIKPIG